MKRCSKTSLPLTGYRLWYEIKQETVLRFDFKSKFRYCWCLLKIYRLRVISSSVGSNHRSEELQPLGSCKKVFAVTTLK